MVWAGHCDKWLEFEGDYLSPPNAKIRNVWNFYPSPFFGVILSPKDSFIIYFKKYVLMSERRNVCPNQYIVVHFFKATDVTYMLNKFLKFFWYTFAMLHVYVICLSARLSSINIYCIPCAV